MQLIIMHSSSYFRTLLVKMCCWKCINQSFYECQLKWLGFLVMHAFILKLEPLITVKRSYYSSEWAFSLFLICIPPITVVYSCSDSSLHVNRCKIFITVPVWKIYFSTFWMNKECWKKLTIFFSPDLFIYLFEENNRLSFAYSSWAHTAEQQGAALI